MENTISVRDLAALSWLQTNDNDYKKAQQAYLKHSTLKAAAKINMCRLIKQISLQTA